MSDRFQPSDRPIRAWRALIESIFQQNIRMFGTFVHFDNYSPIQPTFPGSPLENSAGVSQTTGYESTLGLPQTFSPTLIMELRFGFFRNNSEYLPPSYGINVPSTFGIANSFGFAAPEFNISAFSHLGTNSNTLRTQIDNNYQTIGQSPAKSLGNHLIQFGGRASEKSV